MFERLKRFSWRNHAAPETDWVWDTRFLQAKDFTALPFAGDVMDAEETPL